MSPIDAILDQVEWHEEPPQKPGNLPHVTHKGTFDIMGHRFHCYQLSDGMRVIDADDVHAFFGL